MAYSEDRSQPFTRDKAVRAERGTFASTLKITLPRKTNAFALPLPFALVTMEDLLDNVVAGVQQARREDLSASFARFGYNAATCAAIVDNLNLQTPATLASAPWPSSC